MTVSFLQIFVLRRFLLLLLFISYFWLFFLINARYLVPYKLLFLSVAICIGFCCYFYFIRFCLLPLSSPVAISVCIWGFNFVSISIYPAWYLRRLLTYFSLCQFFFYWCLWNRFQAWNIYWIYCRLDRKQWPVTQSMKLLAVNDILWANHS